MKQEIPAEAERKIVEMVKEYEEQLRELWQWSVEEQEATALEIEERIRAWIRQMGMDTQALLLGSLERYRHKGKQACPECGTEEYWSRYAKRHYISTLGETVIERAYYHHGECGVGWVPLDERLQLGASELSPLVQEMASYLGAWMPFEVAQEYLAKYQDVHISHDTVNNTTVSIGGELRAQQEAEVARVWETGHLPACAATPPPERLYISVDGIHHLLPEGESKELKVAAIYETEPRRSATGELQPHAVQLEYVVATTGEALAKAAYVCAVKRGVEYAEQILVLGDGAAWIWQQVAQMFPQRRTTEILDFYHASEYIWDVARATWGAESETTHTWAEALCHTLKHEGPRPVLRALRTLETSDTAPDSPLDKALRYFVNQGHRMDYPDYRAQGWQIGSGSAESAVKQVVGTRLNQPGMRWNAQRAEAVAHARAAILSHRWDDFWADFQPPQRHYRRSSSPVAA